jgi:very-short-patch-repair endonuclease
VNLAERATEQVITEEGWRGGTTLENRVAWELSRFGFGPHSTFKTRQQYRVGRYRLDFAWPSRLMVLETDGPFHRMPTGAARDAVRDAWLRNRGWVIFRVDDTGDEGQLRMQVARVCRIIRGEEPGMWPAAALRAVRREDGK